MLTKLGELKATKLSAIIGDDGSRKFEAADNGLLDEVLHLGFHYLGKQLGFYPHCKRVNSHQ